MERSMKATAQLSVPDDAMLTITIEMSVADAKKLRAEMTQREAPPRSWVDPMDKLVAVLRISIATAEASHAGVIDPVKNIP
jgi:hypothetical protein